MKQFFDILQRMGPLSNEKNFSSPTDCEAQLRLRITHKHCFHVHDNEE